MCEVAVEADGTIELSASARTKEVELDFFGVEVDSNFAYGSTFVH